MSRLRRLVENLPPAFSKDGLVVPMLSLTCTQATAWNVVGDWLTATPASTVAALRYHLPDYTLTALAAAISAVSGYTAAVVGGVGTLKAILLVDDIQQQTAAGTIYLSGYTAPNHIALGPVARALNQFDDDFDAALLELDPLHADGPWLDFWGLASGLARQADETDAIYATRVRSALIRPKENNFAIAMLVKESPAVVTAVIVDAIVDEFNRADQPSSLGSTDSGTPWAAAWGVWGTLAGKGYNSLPSGGQAGFAADIFGDAMFGDTSGTPDAQIGGMVTLEGGYAGSGVEVTFSTIATGARLVFRQTTPGNEWYVEAQPTLWALVKNDANTITTPATYVAVPANGDLIRVLLTGSTIQVYLNGTLRMTVVDAFNVTATKFGLSTSDTTAAAARFDHFVVGTPGTFTAVLTMAGSATAQDRLNAQAIINAAKALGITASFVYL